MHAPLLHQNKRVHAGFLNAGRSAKEWVIDSFPIARSQGCCSLMKSRTDKGSNKGARHLAAVSSLLRVARVRCTDQDVG